MHAAWEGIYRDDDVHWELYELGEKLADLEEAFQLWRFQHLRTVRRIIGRKRGTGGSTGVNYLMTALEREFFPELLEIPLDSLDWGGFFGATTLHGTGRFRLALSDEY